MCIETILALLYLTILSAVNLFLWKLLSFYVKNSFFINRIKKLTFSKQKDAEISIYFLLLREKKIKKEISMTQKTTFFSLENKIIKNGNDLLILGNSYKYLKKEKSLDTWFEKLFSSQFIDSLFLRDREAL